jgi:hypothetical protein
VFIKKLDQNTLISFLVYHILFYFSPYSLSITAVMSAARLGSLAGCACDACLLSAYRAGTVLRPGLARCYSPAWPSVLGLALTPFVALLRRRGGRQRRRDVSSGRSSPSLPRSLLVACWSLSPSVHSPGRPPHQAAAGRHHRRAPRQLGVEAGE